MVLALFSAVACSSLAISATTLNSTRSERIGSPAGDGSAAFPSASVSGFLQHTVCSLHVRVHRCPGLGCRHLAGLSTGSSGSSLSSSLSSSCPRLCPRLCCLCPRLCPRLCCPCPRPRLCRPRLVVLVFVVLVFVVLVLVLVLAVLSLSTLPRIGSRRRSASE